MVCFRLFGSYEALEGGRTRDALVDMVGGVGDMVDLDEYKKGDKDKKLKLFNMLLESCEDFSLMSASIAVSRLKHIIQNAMLVG